jgi:hypothetical protein
MFSPSAPPSRRPQPKRPGHLARAVAAAGAAAVAVARAALALPERLRRCPAWLADELEALSVRTYRWATADWGRVLVFWGAASLLVALPPVRWAQRTVMAGLVAWLPDCRPGGLPKGWSGAALCWVDHGWAGPALEAALPWIAPIYVWGMTAWAAWWCSGKALAFARALPALWRRSRAASLAAERAKGGLAQPDDSGDSGAPTDQR